MRHPDLRGIASEAKPFPKRGCFWVALLVALGCSWGLSLGYSWAALLVALGCSRVALLVALGVALWAALSLLVIFPVGPTSFATVLARWVEVDVIAAYCCELCN